ncbi:ATP-binding protein [uncultured Sphingomonas sp.]|uniref:PAS domain-containing hybrid sensor histidine kinase/response regulator n=1 Tax=uncultured Sphingomonas sp. TaxID=158754 RepID=UPI0035CAC173
MEDRVLILAPRGRDAEVAATLLTRSGLTVLVCHDVGDLLDAIAAGAGAVMITEEALAGSEIRPLSEWIAAQPAWSDLQFVVLANGHRAPRSAAALERLQALGNIVLLERPLHAEAMIGVVRSALKGRQRQYEVRGFAEAMERAVLDRTVELEAARGSLEFALEAAGMGSWDIDLATHTVTRTLRHDQIFGHDTLIPDWTVSVFLGHVDADQRDMVEAHFAEAPSTGLLDLECGITTKTGEHRWIAAKGRTRYDATGKAVRMTGVVSDITARKEADAQLAQAHKMDAIGQLTGGVAHDFNNLLTPIVGSLDLLRRRTLQDEKALRLIGSAMQAAERAATLTQRLLAFARRQALQPQPVDAGALIEGMSDLLKRSLGPTIAIVLELPHHLPSVRVDPNQLELALLNLAINARDAMPGGGRLTISASSTDADDRNLLDLKPGRYVRITATDIGTGMDKTTLARATEPFFSTKGVGKGTGLGLSMIYGLAAQSGGTLQIESEPGRGTSITIWLPVTDEAVATAADAIGEMVPARTAARILLVDDEEIVRVATADMLRDIGYVVTEATSASQALAAIRGGIEVDGIVTDYLMPGMNGAQLIQELRRANKWLPVLLITGYAAKGEDVPTGVAVLSKPFRQSDLARHLNEALQQVKGGARLRAV